MVANADFGMVTFQDALPTSGSTHDFTSSGFGTPKAAIFIFTRAVADSTVYAGAIMSVGITDGTNQFCAAHQTFNNDSTSRASRAFKNDRVGHYFSDTGTDYGIMSFNSWITDGVRVDLDDAFIFNHLVTVILLKGSDLNVACNAINLGTATTERTISLGFKPQAMFAIGCDHSAYAHTTDAAMSFGMSGLDKSGSLVQRGAWIYGEHNASTTNNKMLYKANRFVAGDGYAVEMTALNEANEFKFQPDANAGGALFGYLVLGIDQPGRITVVKEDIAAGASAHEHDLLGNPVGGLFMLYDYLSESGTVRTTNEYAQGFGAWDGTDEYSISVASEDGVTATNAQSRLLQDRIFLDYQDDGTLRANASHLSDSQDIFRTFNNYVDQFGNDYVMMLFSDDAWIRPVDRVSETDSGLSPTPKKVVSLGLATETDEAQSMSKRKKIGLTTETDLALALAAQRSYDVGIASETDTALAASFRMTWPVNLATETDTALVAMWSKVVDVGLAEETDEATRFVNTYIVAVGLAESTETALSINGQHNYYYDVNQATETDSALALVHGRGVSLGQATEADQALEMLSLGTLRVEETNEAFSITANKQYDVGLATETNTAFVLAEGAAAEEINEAHPITARKAYDFAISTETDSAFGLVYASGVHLGVAQETSFAFKFPTHSRSYDVPLVTETNTALSVTGGFGWQIGQATETNTALAVSTGRYPIGQAESSETAQAISIRVTRPIVVGQATEDDSASSIANQRTLAFGLSTSTETARAISAIGNVKLDQASTTDASFPITVKKNIAIDLTSSSESSMTFEASKRLSIDQTLETQAGRNISGSKARSFSIASEVDEALAFTFTKRLAFGLSSETDTAFDLSLGKFATLGLSAESDLGLLFFHERTFGLSLASETDSALYFIGVAPVADISIELQVTWTGDYAQKVWGYRNIEMTVEAETDAQLT